jgi:alpha-tubulin suppressor-like RCC1 family protein
MSIILRTSNIIISGTTNLTLEKIKTIDTGEHNTLFLSEYGRVYGCGNNRYGQLGSTINNDTDIANPVPTQITETIGSLNIAGISTGGVYGGDHSLFLTHDGKVYGCGHNGSGQLGKAVSNINPIPTQITVTIGSLNIVQVACGGGASLFLTNNGRVYSCGYNRYGNLGLIDNIWIHDPLITPKLVIDINGVSFSTIFISKIRASSHETFFITNDGRVFACGYNWHGQLGHTGSNGSYDYNPNICSDDSSHFNEYDY